MVDLGQKKVNFCSPFLCALFSFFFIKQQLNPTNNQDSA
ncbi:hypothetical protein JCM19300_2944 [Algibacter lectus]|uniref:Uncharacterized protein n=1 Tax=Algibacter lectus TaxID=221126 RepID=A0A090VDM9_9FLAO|nr:hypothetical protein JCM19300_2944 [Algibacter lectus]